MSRMTFPRDSFDDVPRDAQRVGAHRAQRARFHGLVVLLWWLLAVGILTGIGIIAFLTLSRNETISLPELSPRTEQTQPVVDTSYTVVILNGTWSPDTGDQMRDSIIQMGWDEGAVVPLPSDADDIPTTAVYYSGSEDEAAARGLANALAVDTVTHSDEFASLSDGGLTVVVGTDRVSAP